MNESGPEGRQHVAPRVSVGLIMLACTAPEGRKPRCVAILRPSGAVTATSLTQGSRPGLQAVAPPALIRSHVLSPGTSIGVTRSPVKGRQIRVEVCSPYGALAENPVYPGSRPGLHASAAPRLNKAGRPEKLPRTGSGQGARVVEPVLAKRTVVACFINADETADHCV